MGALTRVYGRQGDNSHPITSLPFEAWASFLVLHELATIAGRSGSITQQGHDFLAAATQANLPRFQIL